MFRKPDAAARKRPQSVRADGFKVGSQLVGIDRIAMDKESGVVGDHQARRRSHRWWGGGVAFDAVDEATSARDGGNRSARGTSVRTRGGGGREDQPVLGC